MNKHSLANLTVIGTMMAVAPQMIRFFPDHAPTKPERTVKDMARIEAAERKRQAKQAKRMKGGV